MLVPFEKPTDNKLIPGKKEAIATNSRQQLQQSSRSTKTNQIELRKKRYEIGRLQL